MRAKQVAKSPDILAPPASSLTVMSQLPRKEFICNGHIKQVTTLQVRVDCKPLQINFSHMLLLRSIAKSCIIEIDVVIVAL